MPPPGCTTCPLLQVCTAIRSTPDFWTASSLEVMIMMQINTSKTIIVFLPTACGRHVLLLSGGAMQHSAAAHSWHPGVGCAGAAAGTMPLCLACSTESLEQSCFPGTFTQSRPRAGGGGGGGGIAQRHGGDGGPRGGVLTGVPQLEGAVPAPRHHQAAVLQPLHAADGAAVHANNVPRRLRAVEVVPAKVRGPPINRSVDWHAPRLAITR